MDLKLRALERAYMATPCIATLLPYANETIRAGIYMIETGRDEDNATYDTLRDANGTILDVCHYQRPFEMQVMQHIETQRRRNNQAALGLDPTPDVVALWMSIDGYTPNPDWLYNGLVLS